MGQFSLNWFKSSKQKELEKLKVQEQELKNLLLAKQLTADTELPKSIEKPYKHLKLVNDTLTIVLNDGSVISKPNATTEDFVTARNAFFEETLFTIISSEEVKEEKRKEEAEKERLRNLSKGAQLLASVDEFEMIDDSVYLKGINRSLPPLMVEKFVEIVGRHEYYAGFNTDSIKQRLAEDEEFQSLKNFFMWCCLNPRAEVAHELYRFLHENSFRITKQGFFVALRNVVTLHGGSELVNFVSNTYNKVKAVWKKNPNDYKVFLQNGEYKLVHVDKLYEEETSTSTVCPDCYGDGGFSDFDDENWIDCDTCDGSGEVEEYEFVERHQVNHGELIGGLVELYLDLPNRAENRFTDDWTKTFDIRIGKPVSMPMEDCNWSTQDCAAAGLHFTADQIHYVGCGDQSVLVLINPMKVVGIGQHKGRCYEYLPIMTVPREEATEILHDGEFDTLALDEQYVIDELENLSETVKNNFAAEASKYNFNLPQISSIEIDKIILSLDEMKNAISNRVNKFD